MSGGVLLAFWREAASSPGIEIGHCGRGIAPVVTSSAVLARKMLAVGPSVQYKSLHIG